MIKQGIKGKPGSANETYDFTVLQLCIAAAVKMTNQIPYMSGENTDLLSPSDFINPQGDNHEGVLQLPASCGLANLKQRKQL